MFPMVGFYPRALPCLSVRTNQLICLKAAAHRFNAEEPDWGFTKFCERKKPSTSLETPGSPFSGTEGVKITAYVRVIKDPTGLLWHNFVKYNYSVFVFSFVCGFNLIFTKLDMIQKA